MWWREREGKLAKQGGGPGSVFSSKEFYLYLEIFGKQKILIRGGISNLHSRNNSTAKWRVQGVRLVENTSYQAFGETK